MFLFDAKIKKHWAASKTAPLQQCFFSYFTLRVACIKVRHCTVTGSLPLPLQFSGSSSFLLFRVGLPSTTLTSKHTSRRLSFSLCSTSAFPIQSCGVSKAEGICLLPVFHCFLVVNSFSVLDKQGQHFAFYTSPRAGITSNTSCILSPQLLHTGRVINSGNVLVLKACKTEHPVHVARTPSLSSKKWGI